MKPNPVRFLFFIFISQHLWKREGKKPTNIWDGADEGPHCSAATSLSSRQQTQCEAVSFLSSTLPLIYFFLSRTVADVFFFFFPFTISLLKLLVFRLTCRSLLSLFCFFFLLLCPGGAAWEGKPGQGGCTLLHFVAPLCCVSRAHPLPTLLPPCRGGVGGVRGGLSSLLWSWCLCLDNCAHWLWRAVPPACAESQHAVFHFASL